jgi:hypothetical protein
MFTSGCCAVSDTPAVCVWNRSCGAVLRDLLEEIEVCVEEERQARRERVDVEARFASELDVREAVRQREGELLRRGAAGLADVVAGDRDRVEARHLGRAEPNRVRDEPHRRAGREDELLLRLVLLQDVVLERAADLRARRALAFGVGDEHREHDRGGTVDRHRRRDRAEVDAAVEVLDVGERVDRDAALADLAEREIVVGVAAHECREVERGRQPVAARVEQLAEALVRVGRGAEAREHAHRPELRAVHRRVRPARVRELPGERPVVGCVDGIDLDAREAREVGGARRGRFEGLPPVVARGHEVQSCSPIRAVTPWSLPAV